ncbi:hypothetical protein [Pedobacter punctiformis]|uniref:HTH cro/C1-type domain-containing protein n=1 Tax=Pedobacter punctiformis TaxID=3004097 RepID=A0ABT4LAH8_9SPHI|nr:hypothetical protein [Pedobacter sp. HCMS5-2]MCZ4244918.1 hypothetical protein [Pedobacter sp. HCMS5-2]
MKNDLATAKRLREFRKEFVDNNVDNAGPMLNISKAKLNRMENGENAIDVNVVKILKTKYNLNQAWLFDNKGNKQIKDISKKTSLTTSIELGDRLDSMKTEILILTKNLNRAWEIIERHEKTIDRLEKALK